jgi:hypothetical protein
MNTDKCFRPDGPYAGRDLLAFNIKPSDKVLDIGGGSKPFVFATHVLDTTSPAFAAQRYHQGVHITSEQTLIDGTTDKLFEMEDNEFDFIYTSHLLEHIVNLPEVLEEMGRVGKRGFNAVPHCLYDAWCMTIRHGHQWLCDYDYVNNIFLIKKRTIADYVDRGPELWADVMGSGRNLHWLNYFESHGCAGMRILLGRTDRL